MICKIKKFIGDSYHYVKDKSYDGVSWMAECSSNAVYKLKQCANDSWQYMKDKYHHYAPWATKQDSDVHSDILTDIHDVESDLHDFALDHGIIDYKSDTYHITDDNLI